MASHPLPPLPPGVSITEALKALRAQDPQATAWHLLNRLAAPGLDIRSSLEEVQRLLRQLDSQEGPH